MLSDLEFSPGSSVADNLQKIIDLVPEVAIVLAQLCAVALDRDAEWVSNTLSIRRQYNIVQAQLQVGRYRDFISAASTSIQQMMGI